MKKSPILAMRIWFTVLLPVTFFSILVLGCEVAPEPDEELYETHQKTLSILTWNIQALFDGEEAGNEYEEYLSSSGWVEEKYLGRINAIAQAFEKLESDLPDIIALEEVENAGILTDIAEGPLKDQGFKWSFFASIPDSSLGLGVLSRFEIRKARSHAVYDSGELTPRPAAEVEITPEGKPLILFICHWKSKLGGDDATESLRRSSARILLRRMREIWSADPSMPVLIMGDLNENHDEFYRRYGEAISALLPDDPQAAYISGFEGFGDSENSDAAALPPEKIQADYLVLCKTKPPLAEYFPPEAICLYSPWGTELQDGSYYYKNNWETIDHFLLSTGFFDDSGWEFSSCRVLNIEPFANSRGYPNAYNPRNGAGLSDHLPLLLTLKLVSED
jgi:endonuclease/exonuclease/phosphatase family metal-dependent hydrolase